jgi:methyl-accepting chemotaxis protein
MSIQTKLWGILAGVIITLAVVCFIGLSKLNTLRVALGDVMREEMTPLVNEQVPELNGLNSALELVLNADRDAYQSLRAEYQLVRVPGTDRASALESHSSNQDQVADRMLQASAFFDADLNSIYSKFTDQFKAWVSLSNETVKLTGNSSTMEQAAQMSSNEAAAAFDAMRTSIDDITNLLHEDVAALNEAVVASGARATDLSDKALANVTQAVTLFLGVGIIGSFLIVSAIVVVSLNISRRLSEMLERVQDIASGDGDLTKKVEVKSMDEFGMLGTAINQFIDKVSGIIQMVQSASDRVSSTSMTLAQQGRELEESMNDQRGRIMQVSSAITEMSSSVHEVANQCNTASEAADGSDHTASQGSQAVEETVQGMESIREAMNATSRVVTSLGDKSDHIGEIVQVINDIADQTNLLALNAAIEAARANEHGRGFAVVAEEVRKLAERTQGATEEIADSIRAIQEETQQAITRMEEGSTRVENGTAQAAQAGSHIGTIVTGVQEVSTMLSSIAAATHQQSAVSEEISSSMESIAQIADAATNSASTSAGAAEELREQAATLESLMAQFKLS